MNLDEMKNKIRRLKEEFDDQSVSGVLGMLEDAIDDIKKDNDDIGSMIEKVRKQRQVDLENYWKPINF